MWLVVRASKFSGCSAMQSIQQPEGGSVHIMMSDLSWCWRLRRKMVKLLPESSVRLVLILQEMLGFADT